MTDNSLQVRALAGEGEARACITLDRLIHLAATINCVTVEDVRGRVNTLDVVRARHQVCAILRASGWSYPQIGAAVGRHHSTVINSVRQAGPWEDWMEDLHVDVKQSNVRRCETPSCRETHYARGFCKKHWAKDYRARCAANPPEPTPDEDPPPPTECVDCGAEPFPGGCLRCRTCMVADLDRRVRARRGGDGMKTGKPDPARPSVPYVRLALRRAS